MASDIPAYPMMFSPDQWLNKFSPFAGKAFPFPAQYQRTPTDAHGNPIQSYLDTQAAHDAWQPPAQAAPVTLNTNPGLNGVALGMSPQDPSGSFNTAMLNSMGRNLQPQQGGGRSSAGEGSIAGPALNDVVTMRGMLQNQNTAAAQPAAAPTNPYDMNQAYLDALANPGRVQTPGANVPQSAPPSNQSGVLQQFLANWKGGKGAGNYDNSGFFNALRGQV